VLNLLKFAGGEPHPSSFWEGTKFRFSASSVAIQYLNALPVTDRNRFRNIILLEDRVAVAWPECHAQGLIPFCQANPLLHIERRVSLWRTVFSTGSSSVFSVARAAPGTIHRLQACQVTKRSLAPWIMEALALPQLGMPPQSFKLILDGEPIPEKSIEVFINVVQRDAAWQTAFEQLCAASTNITKWTKMVGKNGFAVRGFPEALRAIVAGDSIVECNFDPGREWGPAPLVRTGKSWTMWQWEHYWYDHEPRNFETEAPLPTWHNLRLEDALPA
jgi:hypothetical protein